MTLTATKEEQKHKRVIYGIGNKFLYKVYGNYKIPTICWECKNAVPNKEGTRGCSWSRKDEQKSVNGSVMVGNCVYECPEFIAD